MENMMQESLPGKASVSGLKRSTRILVVDDEPLILESLSRLIGSQNQDGQKFEVTTASGGQEALAAVGRTRGDYASDCDFWRKCHRQRSWCVARQGGGLYPQTL